MSLSTDVPNLLPSFTLVLVSSHSYQGLLMMALGRKLGMNCSFFFYTAESLFWSFGEILIVKTICCVDNGCPSGGNE